MIDQKGFEENFEDFLKPVKDEIESVFDDLKGELPCCESNYNNADITSGMRCWESGEITEMLQVWFKKITGDL